MSDGADRRRGLGKRKGEEGYGDGRARIDAGDDVLLDEESMVATLLECLNAPDYQPPTLPTVAMDLLRISQQPEASFEEVVGLLEQDSLIAGRVMRIVQSPIYVGAMKTTSLHDALVRLGLRTLRDIVMEIAMNLKVFRSEEYSDTMELLRRHSSATAHLAKLISRYTTIEGDYAFLAGLLHDVGIAGTLLAFCERFASKPGRRRPPDLIAIWPALDRVHEQAAELMGKHWSLPPDLQMAIGAHHQVMIQGFAHPLAATVALANELAHDLGHGLVLEETDATPTMTELERDCLGSHTEIDKSTPKSLEHAREALRIGEAQQQLIEREAAGLLSQLDS